MLRLIPIIPKWFHRYFISQGDCRKSSFPAGEFITWDSDKEASQITKPEWQNSFYINALIKTLNICGAPLRRLSALPEALPSVRRPELLRTPARRFLRKKRTLFYFLLSYISVMHVFYGIISFKDSLFHGCTTRVFRAVLQTDAVQKPYPHRRRFFLTVRIISWTVPSLPGHHTLYAYTCCTYFYKSILKGYSTKIKDYLFVSRLPGGNRLPIICAQILSIHIM